MHNTFNVMFLRSNVGNILSLFLLTFVYFCVSQVGSAAMSAVGDDSGDVNLYIPAYELNKIHVFRLSDVDRRWLDILVR